MLCPCGSSLDYKNCCEVFHSGKEDPPTAEKLMRARYCAYVVKTYSYLQETLDPQTSSDFDPKATQDWGDSVQFVKLEILNATENKNKATVEFKAHYIKDSAEFVHHETSRFRQQSGIWYFRDGKVKPLPS